MYCLGIRNATINQLNIMIQLKSWNKIIVYYTYVDMKCYVSKHIKRIEI